MRVPVQITPRTQRQSEGQGFLRVPSQAGLQSQAELAGSLAQFGNAAGTVGGLLMQQATQARRFGTMQSFDRFQTEVDKKLEDLRRNADPALGNYADIANATYNNMEADWLKTVDDDLRDEFQTQASALRANVDQKSRAFQYESTDTFFRQGITDKLDVAKQSLDQDGSIVNLDAQRAGIDAMIDATTLTEAEKAAQRRAAYIAIESIAYKAEVRRGNLEIGALGVGSAPGRAVDLILEFDGPSLDNGLTYEANQELLSDRVREAEQIAVRAVGSLDRWTAMPERARSVLISLADDEGEIPESVQQAIASGDLEAVAAAVNALGGERRAAEAEILLGTEQMPEGQLDADPRFQNIPYEDRLALRADAEREAAQEQAAEAAAAKAAQEAARNELMVGILDGQKGQYEIDLARENGTLTDYNDIKAAQDLLAKRDEDLRSVQDIQALIASGTTGNPASEDFRNSFNAYIGEAGEMALKARDADYVAQVLVPAVRQLGDLPTEAVGQLTAMTRSQDPQQAVFALDTLSQLQQASPEAYDARVTEDQQADVAYWQSVKDYYPLEEVLSSVRGGDTQEERVRNQARREEAQKQINSGAITFSPGDVGLGGGFFGIGSTGVATQSQGALTADYQQLFIREYQRDGNVNAAKARASEAIKRMWRPTDAGGTRMLMKYPPELTYPSWNGSHDWITEQGRSELGIEGNFQLVSDAQTQAEFQEAAAGTGPAPSYMVTYLDDSGNLTMPFYSVDDAPSPDMIGQPKRIAFEITPEMEAAKVELHQQAQRQAEYDTFMNTYNQAARHSLQTGTPIPEELQEDYNDWVEELGRPDNPALVFDTWGAR